jgi:hypothetical protein
MDMASKEEAGALSFAHANAAIEQAYSLLRTDREAVRAAHWNRMDERTRKMICHMAGIGAEKGAGGLRGLDALERGKVNRAAARLMRDMDTIMKCAQGGAMPAAWGAVQ